MPRYFTWIATFKIFNAMFSIKNSGVSPCLIVCIYFLLFLPFKVEAFEISGRKWIGGKTDFYIDITGNSPLGLSWNAAFIDALDEWNTKTSFTFNTIPSYVNPCVDDYSNGAYFTEDFCGQEYDENTIAVTLLRYESQLLGPPAISEADIYINQSYNFEIYDGGLNQASWLNELVDFRRVVLHELGHVIGLDHVTGIPAIMQPSMGDLDRLQEDDIQAVEKLYGGKKNCEIKPLKFGITNNTLSLSDCSVMQLTAGGDDDSKLDIYSFSLDQLTQLEFALNTDEFEGVILIADQDLNYQASDIDIKNDCNASLNTELTTGNYFLMVNTYNVQMKPACGLTGSYELVAGYSALEVTNLGENLSLKGGVSNADFTGGITATNGQDFGNIFQPTDSIDISATISIDPKHHGQSGFIVVAAAIDDQILFLDESRVFIDSKTQPGMIVRNKRKILNSVEHVEIVQDLVAEDLGINKIVVDFVVGYGLDDDTSEVFYHESPLNLTIQP
jgi:hypothetical protein